MFFNDVQFRYAVIRNKIKSIEQFIYTDVEINYNQYNYIIKYSFKVDLFIGVTCQSQTKK